MLVALLMSPQVRLMRVLTANGIFVEVDTEKYKHNPLSMAYTAVHVRDLVKHMHVSPFSNRTSLKLIPRPQYGSYYAGVLADEPVPSLHQL
jgi:hypothetical protein